MNKTENQIRFGRDDTKIVKGVAVIMMMFHHLAGFRERYPIGFGDFEAIKFNRLIEKDYLYYFAFTSKLCVAIFFFLGGYGLYKQNEKGKFNLFNSIFGLLKRFWKVFIIFIPAAFIFFRRSGEDVSYLAGIYAGHDAHYVVNAIISNFLTLRTDLNGEWWFILPYICVTMFGMLYYTLTKKNNNFIIELFIVFGIDILIRSVFPAILSIECFKGLYSNFFYRNFLINNNASTAFFLGIVFGKYDIVVKLKEKVNKIPCKTFVGLLGCVLIYWSRIYIEGEAADIIYAALFVVFTSVFFDGVKPLGKVFVFLGEHSTNMWLVHSFYCYYFLEFTWLVYSTKNVFIDLMILLILSLTTSILLDYFYEQLGNGYNYVKKFFDKKHDAKQIKEDENNKETEKLIEV